MKQKRPPLLLFMRYKELFDKSDRGVMLLLLMMMVVNAFLEALGIGLIVPVLAAASEPEILADYSIYQWFVSTFGTPSQQELLLGTSLLLLLTYFCKNSFYLFQRHQILKFTFSRQVSTARKLMRGFMFKPYTFHLERNSSELLRMVDSETRFVFQNGVMAAATIMVEGTIILIVLLLLLAAEPVGAILTFCFFGAISFGFVRAIHKKMRLLGLEQQQHGRELVRWVQQGLGGIKESKVLNRELFFIDAHTQSSTRFSEALRRVQLMSAIPRPLIETLGVGGMILLSALMVYQGRSVNDILPILGLFGMAAIRLLPSINRIVTSVTGIRTNVVLLESVLEGLNSLEEDSAKEQARLQDDAPPLELETSIEARELTFRYKSSSERVLDGISFSIGRGELIGFVGSSGAGKSTLVNILLGLLEAEGGELLVDQQPIDPQDARWQKMFGYIAQDTYLCDDTIRRNIAFGIEESKIDDDAIWKALKLARLDDFVRSLPEGLDTMVGEKGTRLSGGQHQRAGIARALYHEPDIIIMDEATSNLDNITEREIADAIEALGGDKTVIIIAHRLTTIRNCDRIYYLKAGKVDAEGDFESLVEQSPDFRALVHAWDREQPRDAS